MQIFDISRPLFNGLAPWPGDTAFDFGLKWKMAEGATVNVGAVRMGVHNGSHADAPFHFSLASADKVTAKASSLFGHESIWIPRATKAAMNLLRLTLLGEL